MSDCATIYLPEINKKITQRKKDKQVNIANLGNKYITLVKNTIEEKNKSCIEFLNNLIVKHSLKNKQQFLNQIDGNEFWINPNILIYVLKQKNDEITKTCLDNLCYDIFLNYRKLIVEKDLYFEESFYVNFIDLQYLNLYQNVNNKEEDGVVFYSLNNFTNYISFLYLQNQQNIQVSKTLSKLKLFLTYEFLGKHNETSFIKFVNKTLKQTELYDFAKTKTLFSGDEQLNKINAHSDEKKEKVKFNKTEKSYQCKLLQKHGGKTEVKTPVGYIDLLTEDCLYELKHYSGWKGAVGQLTTYGHYYPKHKKVLVIFDLPPNYDDTQIKLICNTLDIDVEYM